MNTTKIISDHLFYTIGAEIKHYNVHASSLITKEEILSYKELFSKGKIELWYNNLLNLYTQRLASKEIQIFDTICKKYKSKIISELDNNQEFSSKNIFKFWKYNYRPNIILDWDVLFENEKVEAYYQLHTNKIKGFQNNPEEYTIYYNNSNCSFNIEELDLNPKKFARCLNYYSFDKINENQYPNHTYLDEFQIIDTDEFANIICKSATDFHLVIKIKIPLIEIFHSGGIECYMTDTIKKNSKIYKLENTELIETKLNLLQGFKITQKNKIQLNKSHYTKSIIPTLFK